MPVTKLTGSQLNLTEGVDGMGASKLIKHTETMTGVAGGERKTFLVPMITPKALLKSLWAESTPLTVFDIIITDKAVDGFEEYASLDASGAVYDLMDVPYINEDQLNVIYVTVINRGNEKADITVKLKAVEMN